MKPTNNLQDPLLYLFNKFGFERNDIQEIIIGEKYVGVILNSGDIGLCATLNYTVDNQSIKFSNVDLNNITHRIILNAYYNALINPNNKYDQITDIFDKTDFKKYSDIIMIGYFQSLVKKLDNEKIPLTIFDRQKSDDLLHPMDNQMGMISNADAIILTGTCIFNKTFTTIVNRAKQGCDIYLLGPSSIMHPEFLEMYQLKIIFGMVYNKNDKMLLEMIKTGHGTPSFKAFANKVYIIR